MNTSPTIIATISKWGDNDYSIEYLDLTEENSSELYTSLEPHCSASTRGNSECIAQEASELVGIEPEKQGSIIEKAETALREKTAALQEACAHIDSDALAERAIETLHLNLKERPTMAEELLASDLARGYFVMHVLLNSPYSIRINPHKKK